MFWAPLKMLRCLGNVFSVAAIWLLLATAAFAITTNEFKQKVRKGMSKNEVQAAVGEPDSKTERTGFAIWRYRKIYDAEAAVEVTAGILIKDEVVHGVSFLVEE
jgi:hypothetical protein